MLWTVVLGKTLERSLDSKEIKLANPKGTWSWIFIGRTDAEAETPILWPPDVKTELIGKDPDAGKDWRQQQERDDRGWDGWIASSTKWTRVWANCERQWRTREPGVLQSMRVTKSRTRLSNWTTVVWPVIYLFIFYLCSIPPTQSNKFVL